MTFLLHVTLFASLAGSLPTPVVHAAPAERTDAPTSHYTARLRIDASELGPSLPADAVEEQQRLFDGDVPPFFLGKLSLAEDGEVEVVVRVRWQDFDEFIYGVSIQATTPDGVVHEDSFTFKGDEYDLLVQIEQHVPTVVQWLERPTTPPPAVEPPRAQDPPGTEARPNGRGLLWTGVALAIVGAALVPAGVVMHTQTDSEPDGFGSRSKSRRHPVGLTGALIGVGVAAVGVGVPLIVVGAKRGKESKAHASIAPAVSPSHVGFSMQGRF